MDLSLDKEDTGKETSTRQQEYSSEAAQFPRASLPSEYSIIQLIDANLDLDRHEEQILVAQNSSNSETASIRIFVADYDAIRDKYVITWEEDISAQKRNGLQITVMDTTGDHNLEIICSGIDTDGNQTLDIFRRTTSPGEYGLFFDSVFSLQVNGTIEIQDVKRTQSYQNGLSNGASFPVISNSTDADSDKLGDIIKRTYIWRNDSRRYEMVLEEKVSGTEIEDRRLKELFESGSAAFEEFLHGPWLYTQGQGPGGNAAQSLIHFDSEAHSITFYSGTVQEIYTWTSSQRFLANSLAVRGENEIVPFMRIHISVYVQDLTHIRLSIYNIDSHNGQRSTNTSWSGVYQKIGESLQESFLQIPVSRQTSQSEMPKLMGVFHSDEGNEIIFNPPQFTLEREGETIRGGFSVYNMGSDILELRVLNNHGIPVDRMCYSFDYFEEKKNNEIIRRLFLLPGDIGLHGFIPRSKQPIRYEQVEQIEEDSESENDTDSAAEDSAQSVQ